MKTFGVVQNWIDNVAYSHSRSIHTEKKYRWAMRIFCEFIEKEPEQILEECEGVTDRKFRRKYARYLRALIGKLNREEYAIGSVKAIVAAVRSFFKYNDLPLGHVPVARNKVTFHNRDITREEVINILKISRHREKAFYCMMAQSGLRPDTLSRLKLENIEPEFSEGTIPCKIKIPEDLAKGEFGAYFTFMGQESVNYLKAYLAKRPSISSQHYLFTAHGRNKPLDRSSISHIFRRAITTLKEKGMMDFEQKAKGKPRTVRLYNLRKFFRKHAGLAGIEYVNFWMGHKTDYKAPHIPASDVNYFSREDVEFQRQLYAEKAMPHLRIETSTPTETDLTISRQEKEIQKLKQQIKKLQGNLKQRNHKITEYLDKFAKVEQKLDNLKEKYNQMTVLVETEKGITEIRKQYGREWLEQTVSRMVLDMTENQRKKIVEHARMQLAKQKQKKESL